MIDTSLAAGCLSEVISDVFEQDVKNMKFQKWLAWGHGKSYAQFWGEEYAD